MRAILLAMLVAAGIGLAGSAGVSAAPINGAVIGDAANASENRNHSSHPDPSAEPPARSRQRRMTIVSSSARRVSVSASTHGPLTSSWTRRHGSTLASNA